MESTGTNDMSGEAMLNEEYSGEDSAANAAKNTALSLATLLSSMDKAIIDQATKGMYNEDNINKLYERLLGNEEKLSMVMQKLGMAGGNESSSQPATGAVEPTQGMQKQEMSPEESLAMIAQNGMRNRNGGV